VVEKLPRGNFTILAFADHYTEPALQERENPKKAFKEPMKAQGEENIPYPVIRIYISVIDWSIQLEEIA